MNNNHEFEDRVMLSKEQYFDIMGDLLSQHPNTPIIFQKNDYYDTDDLKLLNNHQVLRIRTISTLKKEMTLKIKKDCCDDEFNETIDHSQYEKFEKNRILPNHIFSSKLAELNILPLMLKNIASISTKRLEIKENDDLIVVDMNTYLDIIDYNLEVESTSREKAHQIIIKFCEKYRLEYNKKYLSKSRRSIQAYQQINKTK